MSAPGPWRNVIAVLAATALLGCQPPDGKELHLSLKLLRGDVNPLVDPGDVSRASAPVGSLQLKIITPAQTVTEVATLNGMTKPTLKLTSLMGSEARVVLRGLRSTDGALYSGGRTVSFPLGDKLPTETPLFFGPVEAFTPVGADMPGPRQGALAVPLGKTGTLVVGGLDSSSGQPVNAEPALLVYDSSKAQLCGPGPGCLTGMMPPGRRDAIAVALTDGTVLHGLGRLASGACDDALYLTAADGSTERLTLAGSPALPPLCGAAALASSDGAVLVFGGENGTAKLSEVWRIDVRARSVQQGTPMLQARSFPSAVALSGGEVLIAGGSGMAGALDSAELYIPGQPSQAIDGDLFTQVRKKMRGPRIAPSMVRLADNGVLIWGGGQPNGEVFQLNLGIRVGGFVDLVAPPVDVPVGAPALLRLKDGQVLFAGGEKVGTAAPQAAIFAPEASQIVSAQSPVYVGAWRRAGAASGLRARPAIAQLADGAALLIGGATLGEGPATSPSAARVEVFVTPLE
jgi:hypothetical protein